MSTERLRWSAPGLDLAALGVDALAALFAPDPARLARCEVLEDSPDRLRVRFALPGTPDARGRLTGRPGALGTGFVVLSVPRADLAARLRARFTAPRSASLAEREWNLLCHLRASGVGTAEPIVVGARGAGLVARESFLVTRDLDGAFPLPRWLRTDGIGAERARGVEALGHFLAALARARVVLPDLAPDDLWVAPSGSGACAEEGAGPRRNRLPGIALAESRSATLAGGPEAAERVLAAPRAALARVLAPDEVAAVLAAAQDGARRPENVR